MSENCDQCCSECEEECTNKQESASDFLENPHKMSRINKVIGIVSGKGGVGKSLDNIHACRRDESKGISDSHT
jgi:Mrp family chromosome partitioning ATPase